MFLHSPPLNAELYVYYWCNACRQPTSVSVRLFKRNYDMLKEAEHIINWQHYDAPQFCFIICLLLSNWLYRNILECTLSTCNNDYLLNELSHILCKFLVNLSFCAANDLSPFKRARREKNHLFWPENGNAVQERLFAVKKIKTLIEIEFVCLSAKIVHRCRIDFKLKLYVEVQIISFETLFFNLKMSIKLQFHFFKEKCVCIKQRTIM